MGDTLSMQDPIENLVGFGRTYGTANDDPMNLHANIYYGEAGPISGQIHAWAYAGNDVINLIFSNISTQTAAGHHVWGDETFFVSHDEKNNNVIDGGYENQYNPSFGNDEFHFNGIDQISGVVVGRINDFDPARDKIFVQGAEIDMSNLSAHPNVYLVLFNGDHQDPRSC